MSKLEEKIQDLVALGEHDAFGGSDDLDSQEVMKLVHVFHLELPKEEYVDLVDVGYVFSTNHQVVDIYDDKYTTT